MLQFRSVRFRRLPGHGEVERVILSRHATGERQDWLYASRKCGGNDSKPIGAAFYDPRRPSLGGVLIGEGFLKGRLTKERRG